MSSEKEGHFNGETRLLGETWKDGEEWEPSIQESKKQEGTDICVEEKKYGHKPLRKLDQSRSEQLFRKRKEVTDTVGKLKAYFLNFCWRKPFLLPFSTWRNDK